MENGRSWDYEDLLALSEGSLDEDAAVALRAQLAASPDLRREYEAMCRIREDMAALSPAPAAPLGDSDLTESVLERVRALSADGTARYDRLADIADGWTAADPEVDDAGALVWVRTLAADMDRLAATVRAQAPSCDLVDQVLRTVSVGETAEPAKVVAFPARRRAGVWGRMAWYAAAAAAVLMMLGGLYQMTLRRDGSGELDRQLAGAEGGVAPGSLDPEATRGPDGPMDRMLAGAGETVLAEGGRSDALEEVAPPDVSAITLADVIRARRAGSADPDEMARFGRWASLSREDALAIVQSPDADVRAVLGAVASLPADEQESYLLMAVGALPESAPARFMLAQNQVAYAADPSEAYAQLETLAALDQQNALPYYVEAKILLDANDVEGALGVLEEARGLPMATAYSLDEALFREQALIASGMDEDAARVLAALTAGDAQHEFLCALGEDLLHYGRFFAEEGEYATAERVYQSVQRFGEQLNQGATLVADELAGLDVQRAAIEGLTELYAVLGSTEGIEALTTQALDLFAGMEGIGEFMQAVEGFIATTSDPDLWSRLATRVLEGGETALVDAYASGAQALEELLGGPAES